MRRTLLLLVGLLALALAAPTVSSAHGGGHHGKHKKWKKAHGAGLPAPAGRVASFENGVLTIELANGSTVAGTVDDDTSIGCVTTPTPPRTPTGLR